MKLKYTALYLASILLVSILFLKFPLIVPITQTVSFSPWVLLVGFWFVLRDFSQREVGHYVFLPMGIGVGLAALLNPAYAAASGIAAAVSEFMDWLVYTFSKKPFHERILISSLVSAPVDTLVFLYVFDMLGVVPGLTLFNIGNILVGSISKLLAAIFIWHKYKK